MHLAKPGGLQSAAASAADPAWRVAHPSLPPPVRPPPRQASDAASFFGLSGQIHGTRSRPAPPFSVSVSVCALAENTKKTPLASLSVYLLPERRVACVAHLPVEEAASLTVGQRKSERGTFYGQIRREKGEEAMSLGRFSLFARCNTVGARHYFE